jgi:uncharacterized protein (TIGR03435 family)
MGFEFHMNRRSLAFGLLAAVSIQIGVSHANAQSARSTDNQSAFEVASIKRTDLNAPISLVVSPGGRFTATGIKLRRLLMYSYNIGSDQISGAPNWANSEKYDIFAKAPEGSIPDFVGRQLELVGQTGRGLGWMANADNESARRLRGMVQSLLAERFQLKIHTETKEVGVYVLQSAKNGPKIREAAAESSPKVSFVMGQLTFQSTPISFLVTLLTELTGRKVLDETGLKGNYDFSLQWMPDRVSQQPVAPPRDGVSPQEFSGPSLFSAVQEQLGLKLTPTKGPVEVLVIDHVERPTEN